MSFEVKWTLEVSASSPIEYLSAIDHINSAASERAEKHQELWVINEHPEDFRIVAWCVIFTPDLNSAG